MRDVRVIQGDSRDVLKAMADNSIDSVVTHPPYALVSIQSGSESLVARPPRAIDAHMRAKRRHVCGAGTTGEIASCRVLGRGHAGGLAWRPRCRASGTRTYHRLAVAIEDVEL